PMSDDIFRGHPTVPRNRGAGVRRLPRSKSHAWLTIVRSAAEKERAFRLPSQRIPDTDGRAESDAGSGLIPRTDGFIRLVEQPAHFVGIGSTRLGRQISGEVGDSPTGLTRLEQADTQISSLQEVLGAQLP